MSKKLIYSLKVNMILYILYPCRISNLTNRKSPCRAGSWKGKHKADIRVTCRRKGKQKVWWKLIISENIKLGRGTEMESNKRKLRTIQSVFSQRSCIVIFCLNFFLLKFLLMIDLVKIARICFLK